MPGAPFDRVENGYDPKQVASFAAQALSWKRELHEAKRSLARYERIIGEIDDVEREAAEIIDQAQAQADRIMERARAVAGAAFDESDETEAAHRIAAEPGDEDRRLRDEVADEMVALYGDRSDMSREEKIEAARAQLFRRRGTLLPQE